MDGGTEAPGDDWGPFGRPLFDDPKARALARVGVIDIGSNSVRLVVFDGAARSPAYFYNEKIMCGLGAGVAETGRLNPSGRARALDALKRFQLLTQGMELNALTVVATAAVREAEDGPDFREDVRRATGLEIWTIDGEQEARLSAQGVLLGWPGSYGLVSDIGGSSMELAELQGGEVGRCMTSRLGPLRLAGIKGGKKGLSQHIRRTVERLREEMGPQPDRLFLVGGSWRAIARIDMVRRAYPLSVLHEYRMSRSDVMATVRHIQKSDPTEMRAAAGLSEARMALVPVASLVLRELVRTFKPHDIATSSYGLREGLLCQQMPQTLRDRDPLIEACRFSEAKDARQPGFGRRLAAFVAPLFPEADDKERRIMKAACLLHDVSWRAHPDYRHEVCFDNATRANLGGLTHQERVFIGVALLHRYKNNRAGSRFEELFGLLSKRELRRAEILGKAMRFGSMFSIEAPDRLGRLAWDKRRKRLEFRITPEMEPLFGEVAESRLRSLAAALGGKPVIVEEVPA